MRGKASLGIDKVARVETKNVTQAAETEIIWSSTQRRIKDFPPIIVAHNEVHTSIKTSQDRSLVACFVGVVIEIDRA